jgi:hypothetical protein
MKATDYLIYPMPGDQWGIQFGGRFLARFASKSQAIQAAITLANVSGTEVIASVIVEAVAGERYPIWTSAKDSYV